MRSTSLLLLLFFFFLLLLQGTEAKRTGKGNKAARHKGDTRYGSLASLALMAAP